MTAKVVYQLALLLRLPIGEVLQRFSADELLQWSTYLSEEPNP